METHPALAGRPVYLDYNATTPVDPRVADSVVPYLVAEFGNPSSAHLFAEGPRRALAVARSRVAALLGAQSHEIVFVASGSEADALAVRGATLARAGTVAGRPHVVTQVTEHPAVLEACRRLEARHDVDVSYLPVDRHGILDPDRVADALTSRTVLVSVMHANNETGTLQPITEISALTRARGVLLHTDAAQSVGKIPVDVDGLGVDLLTVVGHKMYAPKGVAALYVRDGVPVEPLVGGGGQERGLRAGTENVPYAVALGVAADLAREALVAGEPQRLAALRDLLVAELDGHLPGRVRLNGHPERRLPHVANVRIEGARARELLAGIEGLAASTGSACHAAEGQPSTGIQALGLSEEQALATVRLSLGRWTTEDDVVTAAALLAAATRAHTSGARPTGSSTGSSTRSPTKAALQSLGATEA